VTGRFRPIVLRLRGWRAWAFLLGAFAAFIPLGRWNIGTMRRYQLIDIDLPFGIGLLMCLLATATLCWLFVWPTGPFALRLKSSFAAGIALTALVGIGGYHQLNAVLDTSQVSPRPYVIENLDCRRTRRRPAQLWLRPVLEGDTRFSLDVPRSECQSALPGDSVFVELKPGFFGSAWVARYTVSNGKH